MSEAHANSRSTAGTENLGFESREVLDLSEELNSIPEYGTFSNSNVDLDKVS